MNFNLEIQDFIDRKHPSWMCENCAFIVRAKHISFSTPFPVATLEILSRVVIIKLELYKI